MKLFPGTKDNIFRKVLNFCCGCLFLAAAHGQNYDEGKVPTYTLPQLLQTSDGHPIKSATDWERKRLPEVLSLFESNVYGQMPKAYDSLRYTTTHEVGNAMEGKARLEETTITVWRKNRSVALHLTLFLPNSRTKPAPVFLLINNRDKVNTDPTRERRSDFWPAETIIDSGYAVAAFQVNDAAPDTKDSFQYGVLQLYPEQLSANDGMRAIGAWAWAASRIMDYFENEKEIDAGKVCIVGHSRGGKAALWAGAQDRRFAMVFSNCSGNTGAALARRRFGETVKAINTRFPHWFTENYKKFNDREDALPVDQHMLVALIAPRPVYTTNATKDLWADPKGSYLSLLQAQKVYALYRMHSTLTQAPPPVNTPVIHSPLGYHIREGLHDLTAFDWSNFIRFANYHFFHQR